MTQPELNALFASLAGELRALGIPLSKDIDPQPVVNTRAQRRLGCCVHREGRYTIQVSQSVLLSITGVLISIYPSRVWISRQ